jgi:hypothetical protein
VRLRVLGVPLCVAAVCLSWAADVTAQSLTGTLVVTVKDAQGGALPGAVVRLASPVLIGGQPQTTNQKGQARFPLLPPGDYSLAIELQGFASHHETGVRIGAGVMIEATTVLPLAGVAQSVVVEGVSSRIETRDSGFGTRFGADDVRSTPSRRNSMFDLIKAAPGISPTSPSGSTNTVSAFGSATNENHFLFDGTNFTCPCNGVARAEPGIDFIQEVHVQSIGASAEFGNAQGAIINVVTRQGGERYQYDASYYAQTADLTSQPVLRPLAGNQPRETGYTRTRYRDATTNLGGPVVPGRVWFFTGYQYLRDYDSQPGVDPSFPRTYEQNKLLVKITSRPTPRLHLENSLHFEHWVNPSAPTFATPFEATTRNSATVPAMTFGHLTHTLSSNTFWDVRAGRFVYTQTNVPSTGDFETASHVDHVTGITSKAPSQVGAPTIRRTTVKATLNHYRPGFLGNDHQWKTGVQIERGGHQAPLIIPGGTQYIDNDGRPFQTISRAPSMEAGAFRGIAAFVSDAIAIGDRWTVNAGVRFDRNRAFSPDVHAIDARGEEIDGGIAGSGTFYTWNVVSPRLGVTTRLTADGRTMLRASYGRFSQGVLTGEVGMAHPAVTPTITTEFDPVTGGYTRHVSTVDPTHLLVDGETRAPRTDEYSVGIDRELARRLAVGMAYVHKRGANFIGWTDIAGVYGEATRTLSDGRTIPVFVLLSATGDRRFLLTNPQGYSLRYDGLVMLVEKRRSDDGWHAFASYTRSKASGLLPSIANASGAQVSSVSPPYNTLFGRDPNDLTNARGLLANDRPNVFRFMGSIDVPRTGVVIAANMQHYTGKPWAATTRVTLPQGLQRIQLEERGSRRLPSQSLLDVRVSRSLPFGRAARAELILDVLNALNETAAEGIATDNFFSPNFGQPTVFVDPRRAMLSVRFTFAR